MKKLLRCLTAFSLLSCIWLCGCDSTQYSVELDANYTGSNTQTITTGKKLTVSEEPSREGYSFIGWFKDKGLSEKWDIGKDKVTSDMTLYAGWDKNTGGEITNSVTDKDFTKLNTPGKQESSYEYGAFFLPSEDNGAQPYVGDTMPYYEDGTYYIYYLKEGGDSYNHSIYLATTTDFVTYTEQQEVVLEASRSGGQDGWIGTGSVVKVDGKYYFFYTGHGVSEALEYKEKIMVAESDNLTSFKKIAGWEITPPAELGQKNDFRDPQAYYDPETGKISLTVTASQNNTARVIKYTLDKDLKNPVYDGIIFSDASGEGFWNLECSDTFKLGDKWYITYSAQDDTLWYASADSQYGPYSEAKRLDGKLFYAAKHVEDGNASYLVGWARRAESPSSTQDVAGWAGNLLVQKIIRNENGDLILKPVDKVAEQFTARRALKVDDTHIFAESGSAYSYFDAFTCYESFMLTGEFRYTGSGSFGLCFDFNNRQDKYKLISISPKDNKLRLAFNEGKTLIAESAINIEPNRDYSFTYIQEGSVGVFYIDDMAALTVRIYGTSGKTIRLFAENNSVLFSSLRQYTKP